MRTSSRPAFRAVLIVLAALSLALPAGAQEAEPLPEDPFERLAEVRRRQANAAVKVDLLTLSAADVHNRLAAVESWVAAQEQVVTSAQAELVEATLSANEALAAERVKAAELDALEQLMAEIAVEAYMRPPQMAAMNVIITHDLESAEKADVMLRAKAERDESVADDLTRAEEDLRALRIQADEEAERAAGAAEAAAGALDDLHIAQYEQIVLANRIKTDLEQTALQVQLLGGAEADAILAVQRETDALLARISRSTAVPLVDVRGILVHADIATGVEALLAEAEADGIILAGWGHRSTAQQVELRRQHCGGEGIDEATAIYGVSAGSCSPPTAKPGTSMHELGLAIDFTHNGASISTQVSPAFQWLAAHAGDYGLRNLPSEPWHWSVNGD